ncbi:LacI family DNA-binding transcriptional regulator [Actinotalea solisilvae]|uniref:LacI family DNA-binding transcriptional regulator n=1 Tax=Actinotalea solisilvae TaxID=2072922 RepID=UPI0027DCB0CC|nr:LacI family DNA-binding transcriptional regulator [Actinotalea solisilvae]
MKSNALITLHEQQNVRFSESQPNGDVTKRAAHYHHGMPTASGIGRRRAGPSIEDVARLAGVSPQTVSRVSTGAPSVRPSTRAKVVEAMDQLGYSPNRAARALRNGTFGTIGVISHSFQRTGEALTVEALVEAAEPEDYSVTLIHVRNPGPESWETAAHRLSHQAIDGLVILRAERATPDTLSLPAGMPVAVSFSKFAGHYPTVSADQVKGSEDAVRHLLDLGHRTVHHIAGPADSEHALVRTATWRRCLLEAGVRPPEPLYGDWSARSGYEMGRRLAADPGVTAVFCANDETAFGLLEALREHGRRVPDDVSVVGFDDIALSGWASPALTTVRQDFHGIGRALVTLVLDQLRTRTVPPAALTVVPTELIVRASTAPPRR